MIRLIALGIIGLSVTTVLIVGVYALFNEYHRFKTESENLRIIYTEDQKKLVKNEVEKAVEYIEYNRSLSQERIKNDLKIRVDEAWEIANNIYLENHRIKPENEIRKMISDALRPIRFNNGRGDIFIYTTDGVSVMLPRSRKFENRLSLDLRDSLGNFLVQNEVALLREVDQGFLSYRTPGGNHYGDSSIFKYTYVRKFAPLNWYLGSKDYLKDFEDDLKKSLIKWLSNVRYGNEGYIFINTLHGKALLTNGNIPEKPIDIFNTKDANWISVYKQQQITVKNGSGFIEYQFNRLASKDIEPKVSYVMLIKDWGWIVGAGFYKNDIEKEIADNLKEMNAKTTDWVIRMVVLISLFLIFTIIFARFVSKWLREEFRRFTDSFKKASLESGQMNKQQISFKEFRELAESVNNTIAERDNALKALEKEQSLLRSLIDSIPDFIFFKDVNSNYVGCNKAFADFLGMTEKSIIGHNDFDLFTKESAEIYHTNDRKILGDKIPIRNEEWTVFPDGSRRLLDTVKVLYTDVRGEVLGIMALSRDITEKEEIQEQFRAAKEKAEESDRLKTAFLANMSHEIRTPMNSIIGFSTLLGEDYLSESEKAEYIQHINHSGESLLNLIDDIIDIAKIEAGQLTVTSESYSLSELMEELQTTYTELIVRKFKTQINLIVEPVILPFGNTIMTDPFRLRQVISNLVFNAMKFTNQGSITYGFRHEGDDILFYVRDTGIGIAEENQGIIFNRFRQAQNAGKKHYGGTGLGLAISQHIIELLGGKIWVESKLGQGSVFYFTIPYKPVDKQHSDLDPKLRERALFYDWNEKTMLVVEEVDSNFNYISAALSRTGIQLIRAVGGKAGVEISLSDTLIDLVLIDVSLSEMDGYAAAKEIKRNRPLVPVVAQIAYSSQEVTERCQEAGCDEYISKPVKFNVLMNVLSKYLDKKE
ncbi:MAG: cache domain-containing protein [Lentimicrobium sp.]